MFGNGGVGQSPSPKIGQLIPASDVAGGAVQILCAAMAPIRVLWVVGGEGVEKVEAFEKMG